MFHRAQTRTGSGIPYIGHVLGVASIVIETGSGTVTGSGGSKKAAYSRSPAGPSWFLARARALVLSHELGVASGLLASQPER